MSPDDLGPWLAASLRARGWNQAELAKRMGIDPSMVSKWARGSRMPDTPHCEAIARALGVPPYEVLVRANKIPGAHRVPAQHPVRAEAHALVDALDPELLTPVVDLLARIHALVTPDAGRG